MLFVVLLLSVAAWVEPEGTALRAPVEPPALTMGDAVQLALLRNRDLIAQRLQIDEAEVERVVAGLFTNPEIQYGIENLVVGDGNPQGEDLHPTFFQQRVQSVEINQVLDIWFKRTLRRRAADAGIEQARLQVQDAVREVTYAVRSAFAAVLREQWESELARQTRQRYDDTVNLSRKRHDAGEISEAELRKIELEKLKYVNAEINADMELAQTRTRLAALLAFDEASSLPPRLAENAVARATVEPARLVSRALAERPDVRAAAAARQYASLALAAEEREPWPDVSLGFGYTRSLFQVSGDNPHTLQLSLAIPLPVFDRNQGGIGRATIALRRAENAMAAVSVQVHREVSEATQRLGRSRAMLDIFETDMLQRAEAALQVAEKSYRAGAVSLLEILEAQRTYLETRANYLETLYDWRQAVIDVAYATGSDLL